MVGRTSEDVDQVLGCGQFGMARETGEFINAAISWGADQGLGLGEAVGRRLLASGFPFKDTSLLSVAAELELPLTVHVAVGTDIVHLHPSVNPGALGTSTHRDFRLFPGLVSHIAEGVYLNLGSAVIMPEVFRLEGVVMELDDCAFPTLAGVEIGADPNEDLRRGQLRPARRRAPRGPGMERSDLLEANGAIFTAQGKALNEVAADDVRDRVTGNPANTNALIAMSNAPDIPRERFSAMTRLDHNRAISQLAEKTGAAVTDIKKMTIWGNHSATQYPDLFHADSVFTTGWLGGLPASLANFSTTDLSTPDHSAPTLIQRVKKNAHRIVAIKTAIQALLTPHPLWGAIAKTQAVGSGQSDTRRQP